MATFVHTYYTFTPILICLKIPRTVIKEVGDSKSNLKVMLANVLWETVLMYTADCRSHSPVSF